MHACVRDPSMSVLIAICIHSQLNSGAWKQQLVERTHTKGTHALKQNRSWLHLVHPAQTVLSTAEWYTALVQSESSQKHFASHCSPRLVHRNSTSSLSSWRRSRQCTQQHSIVTGSTFRLTGTQLLLLFNVKHDICLELLPVQSESSRKHLASRCAPRRAHKSSTSSLWSGPRIRATSGGITARRPAGRGSCAT